MTLDPTRELLDAMARFDLNPGTIVWNEQIQRFPGPGKPKSNDDGWYIAYADQRGAVFGDWPRGIKEKWQLLNGKKPDDLDPEEWAAMQEEWKKKEEERAAKRAAEQAEAAKACKDRWNAADTKVNPKHPYLLKKKAAPLGLRQDGDLLLVPMHAFEKGNPVVGLQTIDPEGRKRFAEGARVSGTRTTLGARAFKKDKTIYLCEGWATGWTIHQVTEKAVVVAFSCGNLMAVAKELREQYRDARIIIAADNDRWSTVFVDKKKEPNPGVAFARRVTKEVDGVELAVPDFADLAGNPTDFNDLYVREGSEAVTYWLEPDHAREAVTLPEGADADPPEEEVGPPPADVDEWPHFRCLGYDRGSFFYLPRSSGQYVELTAGAHSQKTQLLQLAPLTWWDHMFEISKASNWTAAADALMQRSFQKGVFKPDNLRGRGCWPTENQDGIIVHLGDRLLPPDGNRFIHPEAYDAGDGMVYQRKARLVGPSEDRGLELEEAKAIMSLFQDLQWHDEASAYLLAGWTVLAPICGYLPWRPHVWITGGTGSGKSTVIRDLVRPLTGGMVLYVEGQTTEAGIRQELLDDAIPVVYDEGEVTGAKAEGQIQAVLRLARGASSTGAATLKGTTHGTAIKYICRSMFCMASIGGAIKQESDKTRFSLLQLRRPPDDPESPEAVQRRAHWDSFKPRLAQTVDTRVGRELIARTVKWARDGRLRETLKVFMGASSAVLGDQRSGDQYGTLLSGAWTLMHDQPPEAFEARELVECMDLGEFLADQMPDGMRMLQVLLQQRERVETRNGVKTLAVGQLVDAMCGRPSPALETEAEDVLKQLGLKVDIINGEKMLLVAHSSEWIARALADTAYAANVWPVLRTLTGAIPANQTYFHTGLNCKATAVPMATIRPSR